MADLQSGGVKMPEEKKGKNGKEKSNVDSGEKGEKAVVLSESRKRAISRRKNIQRRKLAGELEKTGAGKKESVKTTRRRSAPKTPSVPLTVTNPDDKLPSLSEIQPPVEPQPLVEAQPEKFSEEDLEQKEEPVKERPGRVREELHPRAQTTGRIEESAIEQDKDEEKSAKEAETDYPVQNVAAEPLDGKEEKLSSTHEPEQGAEQEPITYFAHPFDTEEEPVDQRPVEEDIVIGEKPEKPLPIPVGKMSDEEKNEDVAETPADKPVNVNEEKNGNESDLVDAEAGIIQKELLGEKTATTKKLLEWANEKVGWLFKNVPGVLSKFKSVLGKAVAGVKPGIIVLLLIIILIAGGVYWGIIQGWPSMVGSYVSGFFAPKPVEKVDTVPVVADPNDLRRFGIISTNIFARNSGSVNDLIPVQIKIADYFGGLKEPRVTGETGISAATYYGELKDSKIEINQFVVYMKKLEEMQNLYNTNVYEMLDRFTERDKVLLDYLDRLKMVREESARMLSNIRVNMDELKVSYESLTPDKTKYEKDFFAALDALQPDKSDLLLKGFVDISQKQTALKARVNALVKLVGFYDAALKRLDTRILAIEQNMDALIQGIRVVDIPGAGIDIIIRPQTSK